MTAFTDRCEAVTAALQNVARDLEADLGKLARFRPHQTPSLSGAYVYFADPGPDLASFNQQLAQQARPIPTDLLPWYREVAGQYRSLIETGASSGPEITARNDVLDLANAIAAVTNHQDAADLVASFTESD